MRGLEQLAQRVRRIERSTNQSSLETRWQNAVHGARDRLLADLRSRLPADTVEESFESFSSSMTPHEWEMYQGFKSWLADLAMQAKAIFMRHAR
jgi:hypothetical protein